jgi:hypothetical protein
LMGGPNQLGLMTFMGLGLGAVRHLELVHATPFRGSHRTGLLSRSYI